MTLRAAAYLRVSTQTQDASLETQEQMAREFCERHGWKLTGVYSDILSGKTDKRPEFQRLLDDAKSKPRPFDLVIFYKVDRFARRARFWWEAFGVLEDAGIDIRSLTQEGIANNRQGRIMLSALIMAAEVEGDSIVDRVKDAYKARAIRGDHVPTRPPMGYRYIAGPPRRLELVEEEAELVREAFKFYLETPSARQVAQAMNMQGHRTKQGAIWSAGFVVRLLRNPIYKGDSVFGRQLAERQGRVRRVILKPKEEWIVKEGVFPQLVPPADWDAVQALLDQNANNHPRKIYGMTRYAWSGILRCEGCGGSMHPIRSTEKSKNNWLRIVYVCTRGALSGKGSCNTYARVSQVFLDRVILKWLGGLTAAPITLDTQQKRTRRAGATQNKARRVQALEAERGRWNTMFGHGRITEAEWTAHHERIDDQLAKLASEPAPILLPSLPVNMLGTWEHLTPSQQNRLLKAFISHIDVRRGVATVHLTSYEAWGIEVGPVVFAIIKQYTRRKHAPDGKFAKVW